jgi:hypothetical protein
MGITTEATESTESGEVGIPLRTLQILCVPCGSDLGPNSGIDERYFSIYA